MLIYHRICLNHNKKYTGNTGCYSQSYLYVNLIKKIRLMLSSPSLHVPHRQKLTYRSCLQNVTLICQVKPKHKLFQFRSV